MGKILFELQDTEIKNFDIYCCDYTQKSYQAKKWAFVNNHARFQTLHKQGGLYFDADVKLIKSIEDVLDSRFFTDCEIMSGNNQDLNVIQVFKMEQHLGFD